MIWGTVVQNEMQLFWFVGFYFVYQSSREQRQTRVTIFVFNHNIAVVVLDVNFPPVKILPKSDLILAFLP